MTLVTFVKYECAPCGKMRNHEVVVVDDIGRFAKCVVCESIR